MNDRQGGWERVVGPVGGALLGATVLVLVSGVAAGVAISSSFSISTSTGALIRPGPAAHVPFRFRLDVVVQQINIGTGLLVLAAVALAAFAVSSVPVVARTLAWIGALLSAILVAGSVYGIYTAFEPPGGALGLSLSRKIANASPHAAAFVLSAAAGWWALQVVMPRAAATVPDDDAPPLIETEA